MTVSAGILISVIIFAALLLFFLKKKARPKPSADSPEKKERVINYDDILATVNRNQRIRSVLLAADSLIDLPVTIPVNVAVRIANTQKCLLIDLDVKRNAIARVFNIDAASENDAFKTGSFPTPVENLYVWPARNFEILRQTNLRSLLEGAEKKYDRILIYAPYLTTLLDRRQVASCAKQAIVFTGKDKSRLMKLLDQCNCKVLDEL